MSLRRFFVFALLGAGLGYAALSLRSPSGARDDAVPRSGTASPAAPATARPVPVELVTESAASPPAARERLEPALDDEDAGLEAVEIEADRIELLTAAGFGADRAVQIVRREAELRVAAAADEYAATGTVRPLTGSVQGASAAKLRVELGDDEYARYLRALRLPTSVVVGSIEPGSAAANAGLSPGDEIVAYAGQRVFNARDLSEASMRRSTGETVPATVVRDGQRLQLYVTGGPLGLDPAP